MIRPDIRLWTVSMKYNEIRLLIYVVTKIKAGNTPIQYVQINISLPSALHLLLFLLCILCVYILKSSAFKPQAVFTLSLETFVFCSCYHRFFPLLLSKLALHVKH